MNTLQRTVLVSIWFTIGTLTYSAVSGYRELANISQQPVTIPSIPPLEPKLPPVPTPAPVPSPAIPPIQPPVTDDGGLEYDYAADREAEAYSVQDVHSPYGPRYDY